MEKRDFKPNLLKGKKITYTRRIKARRWRGSKKGLNTLRSGHTVGDKGRSWEKKNRARGTTRGNVQGIRFGDPLKPAKDKEIAWKKRKGMRWRKIRL